jgi:hypothetical protein
MHEKTEVKNADTEIIYEAAGVYMYTGWDGN